MRQGDQDDPEREDYRLQPEKVAFPVSAMDASFPGARDFAENACFVQQNKKRIKKTKNILTSLRYLCYSLQENCQRQQVP